LHGDLSPNNIIIFEGKGFFIDFDHAKFLSDDGKADTSLCGMVHDGHLVQHMPYDDLESLFYILL
ncbi:hypothetical protein P692DRAFT_20650377, partial [Suillus brevipes Sb2]